MKQNQLAVLFIELIVALFVLLFLYTAISKLKDVTGFARAMKHSAIIGPYAKPLACIVPLIEIITTLMLIIPKTRYAGLITATLLMSAFTAYIGYMLMTASELPCTCGGILEAMNWKAHLLFNSVFLLLGALGIFLSNKSFIMIDRSSRTPGKHSRQHFN